jgi:hypothetical protein
MGKSLKGAAVLLAAAGVLIGAQASRRATVLLQSGERVAGVFEDIQDNLVYMRLSQDDERRVPVSQVIVIDFVGGARGLPDTELTAARSTQDLLLLRNGTSIKGTLVEVRREGERDVTKEGAPVTVVFRGADGSTREVAIEEVGRLYIGPPPDLAGMPGTVAPSAPSPAPPPADRPTNFGPGQRGWVAANRPWTLTGQLVRQGEFVSFSASGEVRLHGNDVASPAGSKQGAYSAGAPLPQVLMGALIGRINNQTFAIGDQTRPLPMPAMGEIQLGVNLAPAEMRDNDTGFEVAITRHPELQRR